MHNYYIIELKGAYDKNRCQRKIYLCENTHVSLSIQRRTKFTQTKFNESQYERFPVAVYTKAYVLLINALSQKLLNSI